MWWPPDQGISILETPGFVYFVQADVVGLIKIGWATKPQARIDSLQPFSPVALKLLLCVPGDGILERSLHKRFATARTHGEWFQPVPELLGLIEQWREMPPPAPNWPAERTPHPLLRPLSRI